VIRHSESARRGVGSVRSCREDGPDATTGERRPARSVGLLTGKRVGSHPYMGGRTGLSVCGQSHAEGFELAVDRASEDAFLARAWAYRAL